MNIKLIRLQTGEDLIADVVKEGAALTLENPCMVYVRQSQTGTSASIGITKWIPYSDSKQFTIDNKWIVIITEPAEDLKNEYNKAFGSGIVVAPAGLKVN
jgi:hypothetical protein